MSIATEPRLVQKLEGAPWEIEGYLKVGGYEAWKRCVDGLKAEDVVAELKKAGLRGRGGAGFPTGVKWDKVLNHRVKEHYFVCNAGEHEPGTFKDRYLLKTLPHQLIEGCLIASFAMRANACYIYIRGEFIAIDHALDQLTPGDLCLVLIDQVDEALAHIGKRVAEQR
mgnify:CR=1 FL=1